MFRNNTYNPDGTGKKKSVLAIIFFISILVGFFLYLIVSGVRTLAGDGETEAYIDAAAPVLTLEHSINGLIPTGTEYYYIGIDTESAKVYLLRAGKHWFDDNFDAETKMSNAEAFRVKAAQIKVDYEVSREINLSSADFEGLQFVTGTGSCYDVLYHTIAVRKIIGAALILLTTISLILFVKFADLWGKWFAVTVLVLFMGCLVYLINLFTYI